MANTVKATVRFRTRHKDEENYQCRRQFNQSPFSIIVSYDKKKLSIPCTFRCRVIPSWDIFQQLNATGLPKDPNTTDKEVVKCSRLLQETKRIYLATLEKAIKDGVWGNMNTKDFMRYLINNENDI